MLVEKTLLPNDIISFKLHSGEEVVCKLVSISDTSIRVSKPIILAHGPSGQPVAVPFMLTVDSDEEIMFDIVQLSSRPAKTSQNFTKQYVNITSSVKIATPGDAAKAGLII